MAALKTNKALAPFINLGLAVVIIIAVNIIASRFPLRLDVTEGRIFSLSDGSKSIVKKIKEPVEIRFFFSRSHKGLPVFIKTFATRVEEVLSEYKALSGGKINLQTYDPKPDTDEDEMARKYGVSPMNLQDGTELFFGAVIVQGKSEVAIPYFDVRREEFVEFDISEALVRVQTRNKGKVGILSALPLMGQQAPPVPGMGPQATPPWILVSELQKTFEVVAIPSDTHTVDNGVEVLLVFHPRGLKDEALYAIDQFVMRGGKLIVALDPFSRVEQAMMNPAQRQSGMVAITSSELKKLLEPWGVDFNNEQLVGDLQGMARINTQQGVLNYPYFLTLTKKNFGAGNPVTGKLNQINFAEGGAFTFKGTVPGLEFRPILQTSRDSGTGQAMMAAVSPPEAMVREFAKSPNGDEKVLAGFLQGEFKSAFSAGKPGGSNYGDPHRAKGDAANSVMLLGDVDFLYDDHMVEKFRFGQQVIIRPRNDNLAFILNAVEFMGGSQDLIAIRSQGKIARPFGKVEDLQKRAQERWQAEEERLNQELQGLQRKLSELQGQRSEGGKLQISLEQQGEIKKFREEEARVRKARREVRKNLREDIERLGRRLVAMNMIVVPFGIIIFGFAVHWRRSQRSTRGQKRA